MTEIQKLLFAQLTPPSSLHSTSKNALHAHEPCVQSKLSSAGQDWGLHHRDRCTISNLGGLDLGGCVPRPLVTGEDKHPGRVSPGQSSYVSPHVLGHPVDSRCAS